MWLNAEMADTMQIEANRLEIADRAWGVSDVDRDQLLKSQAEPPLMLPQLCLLRPHIPAGQAHFTLITCGDLWAGWAFGRTFGRANSIKCNVQICSYKRI